MNAVEELFANYKAVKQRLQNPPRAVERAVGLDSRAGFTAPEAPKVGRPKLTQRTPSYEEKIAEVFKRAAQTHGYQSPSKHRDKILAEVCSEHNLAPTQVISRIKTKPLVYARQHFFARLKNEKGMSYSQIGKIYGYDHTTVMHAVEKYNTRIEKIMEQGS